MTFCAVFGAREERRPRVLGRAIGFALTSFLSLVLISASGQECPNSGTELAVKASLAIIQTRRGSSVVHRENLDTGDVFLFNSGNCAGQLRAIRERFKLSDAFNVTNRIPNGGPL